LTGTTSAKATSSLPGARSSLDGTTSYHGQPILKAPVWSWEIPNYLFVGGLSGASASLAFAAEIRGQREVGRRGWLVSTGALMLCPPLLISDLGRPERFLNMLRMFKVTSPMSVGSWILSLSGATTTVASAHALTGRLSGPAVVARPVAAVSGLGLATYTAALFAQTAVPAWHEARRTLPFVFAAGAALSAAGAVTAATPVEAARIPRRLALGAAVAELASTRVMERQLGVYGEPYHAGRARTFSWLSRGCIAAGGAVLGRRGARSRAAALAGGALLCAGAWATRWSVFEAGKQSAADPRSVVGPQRGRLNARADAQTANRSASA
jgi:hypothetical protein